MNKLFILSIFVFILDINLFSAQKEINETVLVFDFEIKDESLSNDNLTEIFIEELKNNYDYEITTNPNKPTVKEIIDLGASRNSEKVVMGRLSFFQNNYCLEISCFSVEERELIARETIVAANIERLEMKLKETAKVFFDEKKTSKEERKQLRKQKKIKFLSEKSGKVGKRMVGGGITASILSSLAFSGLVWAHISVGMSLGALSVFIHLILSLCTIMFAVLIIAGIVLIGVGSSFIYRHKKADVSTFTGVKEKNIQIGLELKI